MAELDMRSQLIFPVRQIGGVVTVGLWLFVPTTGFAQTYTWSPTTFPANWSVPGYWTPAGGPPNSSGAQASFTSVSFFASQPLVDGDFRLGRLTFAPISSFPINYFAQQAAPGLGQLILDNGTSPAIIEAMPA